MDVKITGIPTKLKEDICSKLYEFLAQDGYAFCLEESNDEIQIDIEAIDSSKI